MQCPHCAVQVDDAALECASCRGDTSYQVTMLDGQTFGPYSLASLSRYVQEGRILGNASASQGGRPARPLYEILAKAGEPTASAGAPYPQARAKKGGASCWIIGLIVALVVAVPMALMAAVLFPVFAKARGKARQAACQSNMKQLSLGVMMYCQDYDEAFPSESRWQDSIYPYINNEMVFNCPDTQLGRESYEYNPVLDLRKTDTIQQPWQSILFWEAGYPNPPGPHNEGWNLAYTDGHVKWTRQPQPDGYVNF